MTLSTENLSASAEYLRIETGLVRELLTGFIADEVHKVGFKRGIVAVSGGIDSTLTVALAAEALGAENMTALIMPYRQSSPESERDGRLICEQLGIEPVVVDISPQIDAYFERFPDADRGRRGNKMARERMSVLFDFSWAKEALVIGTSNKTELLLGYSTWYGDMAYALNPIGDLYKTQVWELSRAMSLPPQIIDKVPSADLWAGQSDEEELGYTYGMLDLLLYHLVDERCSRAELLQMGFDEIFVDHVLERVRRSQYKRRPPVIAKLSGRTIDRDFRYPRDWGV